MQQRVRNFNFLLKKELIILAVSLCFQTETPIKVEGENVHDSFNVTCEHEYCKKNLRKNPPFQVKMKKYVRGLQTGPRSLLVLLCPRGP